MVSRRIVVFGILATTTLLISFVNLYMRDERYGAILSYSSSVRFLSRSDAASHDTRPDEVDRGPPPWSGQPAGVKDGEPHDTCTIKETKGFLLALYVLEQLTMSSSHFLSLLNLAHSWRLTGVEPTICHSRMYGMPGLSDVCPHTEQRDSGSSQQNSVELKYGRLYNLSHLNDELITCLDAKGRQMYNRKDTQRNSSPCRIIESLENFIQFSYRKIVLVHFVRGIGGGASKMTFLPRDMMRLFEVSVKFHTGEPIIDCTEEARNSHVTDVVEHLFNRMYPTTSVTVFVVQRVICISTNQAKDGIDLIQLENSIFRSMPNVSVVFTKWQNRGVISTRGGDILSRCKVSPIHHSQEVISASKQFLLSRNINKPFLAVHLRLERLFQCEAKIPGYTKCCVRRIASLLSKVQQKYGINEKDVLIIKDYGPYGTDSCTYKLKYVNLLICLNLTQEFLTSLEDYGYHASEFLPKDYGSSIPDNSGFVSLVEAQTILSGTALITSGFGSYQGTIIKLFLGIDDPNISFKHFDNNHNYGPSSLYDRFYRVCTCSQLKGHLEKLNGIDIGMHSCDLEK